MTEVNSSPGLEGIETATGKDIADMMIDFIEHNAKPGRTRNADEVGRHLGAHHAEVERDNPDLPNDPPIV